MSDAALQLPRPPHSTCVGNLQCTALVPHASDPKDPNKQEPIAEKLAMQTESMFLMMKAQYECCVHPGDSAITACLEDMEKSETMKPS